MADSITIQNNDLIPLVDDLRQIINQARKRVAVNVNAELTLMYWHIGERINREVLGNERAEYGNGLCRQCRHNCSWNLAVRDLSPELSTE